MTTSTSITIGPSPLRILGKLAVGSVALTAGVYFLVGPLGFLLAAWLLPPWVLLHAGDITAGIAALLACYCLVAVLGTVVGGRPRVEIGPDGFVVRGAFGRRSRRWGDVDGDFVVVRAGWQSAVAYRITAAAKGPAWTRPNNSPAGYDEAILICGELTMGAGELAEVLNHWKQGAASTSQ